MNSRFRVICFFIFLVGYTAAAPRPLDFDAMGRKIKEFGRKVMPVMRGTCGVINDISAINDQLQGRSIENYPGTFRSQVPQFNPQFPQFNPQYPQFNPQFPQFPQFNPQFPQFNPQFPQFNPQNTQFKQQIPQLSTGNEAKRPQISEINPQNPQINDQDVKLAIDTPIDSSIPEVQNPLNQPVQEEIDNSIPPDPSEENDNVNNPVEISEDSLENEDTNQILSSARNDY